MAQGSEGSAGGIGRRQAAKQRTQRRLLAAARQMAAAGEEISIARVAERAGISTATAYRYYSDVPSLMSDAALDLRMDDGRGNFLVEYEARAAGVSDPFERLLVAQRQMLEFTSGNEIEYRLFLSKSQEQYVREAARGTPVVRGGRRVLMIEAALRDLKARMSAAAYRDLVVALMLLTGPEPFFTLTDYAGMKGEALFETNARALRDVFDAHMARAGL